MGARTFFPRAGIRNMGLPILFRAFIVCSLVLGGVPIRAADPPVPPGALAVPDSVKRFLSPLRDAWRRLYTVISDRDRFPRDKSAAVDRFFADIQQICGNQCDRLGDVVKAVTGEAARFQEEHPQAPVPLDPTTVSDLWDTYGSQLSPDVIARRLPSVLSLVRQIVALEEANLFAILSEGDPLTNRIDGAARIADSASFLYRQGRAILRLATLLREIAQRSEASMKSACEDGKTVLGLRQAFRTACSSLEEFLPRIVGAVEDLGTYYVKLAQTFGTLAYAVSPDAYEKFEKFQSDNTIRMSEPDVISAIEADLGGPWQEFYAELDLRPFANASNAQIHDAKIRLRGGKTRDVIVKVQKAFVANDLAWNQKVNSLFFQWVKTEWMEGEDSIVLDLVADIAASLGETFRSELDYPAEVLRQELMRRTLAVRRRDIAIPRIYTHLSGQRIITMDKVKGMQKFGASLRRTFFQPEAPTEDPRNSFTVGGQEVFLDPAAPSEAADGAEAETVADREGATAENRAEPAPEAAAKTTFFDAFRETYRKTNAATGYKISAQYVQFFFRGLGPPISIFLAYRKARARIEAAGLESLTEEQRKEWEALTKRFKALQGAMLDMSLHMGELHSDLQPANAQELVGTSRSVLLDWGQTVSTRGLIWNPIRLTWALMRGDEVGLAKVLARMGTLRDGHTYRDLVPYADEFLRKAGFEKRGRWAAFRSLRKKKAENPKEEEIEERPESWRARPTEFVPDDEEVRPLATRASGAKRPDALRARPQEAMKDTVRNLKEALIKFPVRHAEYLVLRGYAKAAEVYDLLLGKRIARAITLRRFRQSPCARLVAGGEERGS